MLLPKPNEDEIKAFQKKYRHDPTRDLMKKWRKDNLEALWDRADASYAVDRQVIIDLIELLLEE
jgi:hypothetical protein